jgi:hypothetical protein
MRKIHLWPTLAVAWKSEAFHPPATLSSVITNGVRCDRRYDTSTVCALSIGDDSNIPDELVSFTTTSSRLKQDLYQLAASYDRGFSATPKARREASEIIEKLAAINPTSEASKGIDGGAYGQNDVPLKATWRMIWTSALDVVSLGASPFAGKAVKSFVLQLKKLHSLH